MHIVDYPARQFAKIAQVSNTVQPMLLVTGVYTVAPPEI
jgi:hypothetical protein